MRRLRIWMWALAVAVAPEMGASQQFEATDQAVPIRADALLRGKADSVPVGHLLTEAVGSDAWVLFADEADASITVSFEGPKWATDAVNDALIEAGLKGIWTDRTLVVYGDSKPYIVGRTFREQRRDGDPQYIVPAGSVSQVFSHVAAEHGRSPMVDDALLAQDWGFKYALKFSGESLQSDLDELRGMIDQMAGGNFVSFTDFTGEAAILQLNQPHQPNPALADRYACYRSYHSEKAYHEIKADMDKCRNAGVWIVAPDKK